MRKENWHSTTIVAVRRGNHVALGGDGQITLGNMVMKNSAKKVRKMNDGKIIGGFAGSAADGIALFERLEGKLREWGGQLQRAAVELAKDWRTDKALRRLDALLLVCDAEKTLILSGTGDIVESEEGISSIGSGSGYAIAAGRALLQNTSLNAKEIAQKALSIAGDLCIYTNQQHVFEEIV